MAVGAFTLKTGINVFQPLDFAKSRDNVEIMVNGSERGLVWNGITSTTYELGMDAPAAAPTVTASGSGNGASTGIYQCGYRYAQTWAPAVYSSLSALQAVSASSGNKFTWTVAFSASSGQLAREDMVQFFRSTADQAITLYKVAEIGRTGSITSADGSGGFCVFTVPAGHNLIVGAIVTVTDVGSYNGASQTVTATTSTTFTTDKVDPGGAADTDGTWSLTGYSADDDSDAVIELNEDLRITNPDGSVNAYRQVPPPTHKPFVCMFQDRCWYGGWVPYTAGTVTTSGTTVSGTTGSGTSTNWTSDMAGRYIVVAGDTVARLISTASASSITTASAMPTISSAAAYAIIASHEERNQIYFSERDEPESVSTLNVVAVQENTGDDDIVTGLMPDGGYLYALKERHVYRIGYFSQPTIDVSIVLVTHRGCVNNRCWDTLSNTAFLMDQQGIYAFQNGTATPISEPIDDLFRDGAIDWSDSKWFFCQADPLQQTVRFHVTYTDDSSAIRPLRWLEFNLRTKTWQTGSYVGELGGACLVDISGRTRVLVGGENEYVYIMGEGVYDHENMSAIGTCTIGFGGDTSVTSATKIRDITLAPFTATMVGAPVGIITGTGKTAIGKITAFNSTSSITVGTLSPAPIAGDTYFVGAIKYDLATGNMVLPPTGGEVTCMARLLYQPTTNAATMDIRRWLDFATAAEYAWTTSDRGKGITTVKDSQDAILDMKLTRSAQGDAPGFAIYDMPSRRDDYAQCQRQLLLEFRGFQTRDQIKLLTIDVVGASE